MPEPIDRFRTQPPTAVTFDFWDTLVRSDLMPTREARATAVAAALADLDRAVDDDALAGAIAEAGRDYAEHWHANRQYTAEDGAGFVLRSLGLDGDRAVVDAVMSAFVQAAADIEVEITPNIAPTLRRLRDAGVKIGIVCDVGMTPSVTLRGYLDSHGLLELFDGWSFSDEVGVFKPDPVIFRHALDGLGGVEPERAAHIGDLNRTDIAGAAAVGMAAVRYAGVNDDGHPLLEGGPEADPGVLAVTADAVISDHAALPAVLGLG
ncbi:MAG: HAD family hydrolase [Acidimicrobiia bacterium]|nr:HAD family hydrolase [Acidimicrobiia bacterium]